MADQTSTRLRHPEFRGRIGVARAEITPPIGIYSRTWGSARHDQAEGIHRPLLATCLRFQDARGGDELILITLDVMIFWQEEADRIRAAILQQRGLKPHQLILHPSHSHGTPFYLRRQMDRPGGDLIAPYLASIPARCCSLIDEARKSARDAILTWAYGRCGLAFNRDAIDPASGRDICGLNLAVEADQHRAGRTHCGPRWHGARNHRQLRLPPGLARWRQSSALAGLHRRHARSRGTTDRGCHLRFLSGGGRGCHPST